MAYTPDTPLDLTNPDDWNYYRQGVISKESSGDINAQNPSSSANGIFQMIKDTRDKYAAGKDWKDPAVQEEAGKAFSADNAKLLQDRGHPVTARNLYLSHFLGGGDAPDVLDAAKSDPTDGIANYVQDSSLAANKSVLGGKSVADVLNWAGGRFGGGGGVTSLMPKAMGQGALSDTPKPTPSAIGGLYDALIGGPGALSAEGPDGLGPIQRFGEGLQGVGAALMARDNPQGAAALRAGVTSAQNARLQLAQLAMQKQKYAQSQNLGTKVSENKQGDAVYLQPDGSLKTYKAPEMPEDTSVPQKLMTSIAPTVTSVTQSMDIDKKMQDLQEKLSKGQFSMRADQQGKFILQNLTDHSSEGAQAAKDYQALLNQYVEGVMNANKGAGTQWKRDMAVATAIPAGGQWDNAQILDGMQRIRDLNKNRYDGYSQQLRQMEQAYPDFAKQAPSGSWIKTFDDHEASRNKRDTEVIQPLMKQFKDNRAAKQAGVSAADQILQQWRNK